MKRTLVITALTAALLPLLAACNSGADVAASPATVTVTSPAPAPAPASTSAAPAPVATMSAQPAPQVVATTATVDFPMPDTTGIVLQDAQDQLQTLGVFYSTSHDELGVRHQVLDRDWQVCSQNVAAGQQVTGDAEGQIDFGVVKLSESCP